MAQKNILVVGSLNIDLVTNTPRVPGGGETITASSFAVQNGGKGANQAVACARLSRKSSDRHSSDVDVKVKMVGCVGDDDFGKRLKKGLLDDGIDVSGVEELEGVSSGVAVILVEPSGENRILITPGANALHKASPEHLNPPPSAIVFQLETPLEEVQRMMSFAAEASPRPLVVFNPAPAIPLPKEMYAQVDYLIVNETEAAMLSELGVNPSDEQSLKNAATVFVERGVRQAVIITLGSQGAFFYDCAGEAHESGLVSAIKVKAVDTTAAGDTFLGAFSVRILTTQDVREAVSWAIQASSITVQKPGAQNSIPWLEEVA